MALRHEPETTGNRMPFYRFAPAAAIALLSAEARAADLLTAVSPNEIRAIIAEFGGEAEVVETDVDATVEGAIDGKVYSVLFYDCDGGAFDGPARPDSDCLGYEYRAYFTDFPNDAETINRFNADNHYGEMWRDEEGDLVLQFNLVVEGGVSEDNIRAGFGWWRNVLTSFDDHMEER